MAGVHEATANVIGVRSTPYSNVQLDNSALTFESTDQETATVDATGRITGIKQGETTIKVTYQGLQDLISVNIGE